MTCPACGERNPQELVECESCGELLVDIFAASRSGSEVASPEPEQSDADAGEPAPEPPVTAVMTAVLPRHVRFGDRYEILDLIGEGGMGRVYKARDLELDRLIALKTIRSEKSGDPETVRRFKQELVLARRITHKNVVRIYDLGEANGVKFFTMELLEGDSLKAIIQRDGKIPVSRVTSMLTQMLSALEEAHTQGVIHRDLKPQNIMVSPDGTPHIMDFGIARSAGSAGLTATGSVLGTPDYIAPEQVSGEETNAQSDLFSLGVILYEMLTGKVPYDADTPIGKVMMRLSQKPRALREITPEIPAYLERMVLKCLEVDPVLRYQSAGEVLEDLEREQVDRSWIPRARRALGRRKASLAAAAVLCLLFGAAAYMPYVDAERDAPVEPEEEVRTLAILPFVNATGSEDLDWMRTGLAEMLVTDISQSRFVRPVPGERIFKIMRQLEIHEQSRFDEAALVSIAQLAPADSVLYGQFVQLGESVRMDLTLRDTASGVPTPIKVEADSSKLFALVDRITQQVKEHLDLSPEQLKGDTDRPIADVATSSLAALRSYQAGLALLRQDSNQAAIPLFKEATERDPDFAMAYAKLAESYLNAGEHKEAKTAIERARILSEKAPLPVAERYQIHAIVALVNQDYETAAKSYGELAALYPDDPDIHLSRARALEDLGELPESLQAYQRVSELAPDYGAALLGMARVQSLTGQASEAIRSAEGALGSGQFENDLEAKGLIHSILGVAYRDTGRLDEAIEHLTLSLDLRRQGGHKKGQATTLTNMAAVYEQWGQIDRALAAEKQALALTREIADRPQESITLYNIGLTYKFAGRLSEALEAFRGSLQIEMERGDHMELAIRLGEIGDTYRIRGQYADATVYLEQAKIHLERSGDKLAEGFNLIYIGQVKRALGLNDDATKNLLGALAIFQELDYRQGVADAHVRLANTYGSQGRYAEAYQALRRSVEISQELDAGWDLALARTYLGHFFLQVGHLDEAESELTEARGVAEQAYAKDLMPLILLGQGTLERFRGRAGHAAELSVAAQRQAERIGQKEISLKANLELGRSYIALGRLGDAESVLAAARTEAMRIGARPTQAEAALALAEVYLTSGDAESASDSARQAVAMAETFSGRPLLIQALATLGEAYEALDRTEEATEAYARAAATLNWFRRSLSPEHVEGFRNRPDLKLRLDRALIAVAGGKGPETPAGEPR